MKMRRGIIVMAVGLLVSSAWLQAEEKAGGEDMIAMEKRRLENLDKQGVDKEKLQKEAESDPALGAALQKREAAIAAMRTHVQDTIAAMEAGDKEKVRELRGREKDLSQQLDVSNKSIEFARKAASLRRDLDGMKKRAAEKPDGTAAVAPRLEKAMTELAALYDGLAANPPAAGKWMDDATAQKIAELEAECDKARVDIEFDALKAKLEAEIQAAGDNAAVKEAGQKLLDYHARMKDVRMAVAEARIKERALQQERSKLEMAFQEAMSKAKQEQREKEQAAKKAAREAEKAAAKPAGKPAEPAVPAAPAP